MWEIHRDRNEGAVTSFSSLVFVFWDSKTSDPKDKIFALLGLNDEMSSRMQADYRGSVQTIYTTATQNLLLNNGSREILSLAGIRNE
jgi:hypothetical protein